MGEVGGGAIAVAALTPAALLAACSSDSSDDSGAAAGDADTASTTGTSAADSGLSTDAPAGDSEDAELRWARTELGFVSAYVLARGNRATIVDTGTPGSADAIGQSLQDLGLNYSDVENVVLTHKHGDHAGSITEVLARAEGARAFAGEADLVGIIGDISPLVGGEDVFGLEVLATPGHTPGHMSVIDHAAGLLVAGDAVWTDGGEVIEGQEQFTSDLDASRESIRALAGLTFNTLLVGHGDPIEGGADQSVAALAAALG